jgi:hypothetical protein
MKKTGSPTYLNYLAFVVFVLLGAGMSLLLPRCINKQATPSPTLEQEPISRLLYTPQPTAPSNQLNLLIIGVDRLAPRAARLVSVWLAITLPGENIMHISFKAIYPLPPDQTSTLANEMAASFELNETLEPSQAFLDLARRQTFFSGYIILDEITMVDLVELLSLNTPSLPAVDSLYMIGDIPLTWQDATAAHQGQFALLEWACTRLSILKPKTSVETILALQGSHLQTDLDLVQLVQTWKQALKNLPERQCEVLP